MKILFKGFIYESITESIIGYHIAFARDIELISDEGLDVSYGGGNLGAGKYGSHSEGRIFFSTCGDDVSYWYSQMESLAENRSDDYLVDGLVPIVLRFKATEVNVDEIASKDDRRNCSHYTTENIPPNELEYYYNGWHPINQFDSSKMLEALDSDGYFNSYSQNPFYPTIA